MADLTLLAAPAATVNPTDVIDDILSTLRAHHPTPLAVVQAGQVVGTVGLDAVIPAFGEALATTTVLSVMNPVATVEAGQTIDAVASALVAQSGFAADVLRHVGGLFSGRTESAGLISQTEILAEIGKNVIDKAPMKILSGHRDLGFNVPISPCQRNCPIKQDIATYVDYVSQGRYVDSWMVIHETNPFPSMLGRLCNHPCETDCKRGWDPGEEPVTIRSIKRFSTDFAFKQGLWVNYKIGESKGKKVAVVGAGPAGLTCALDLRVQGYDVVLYEREAKVGGLLSTSIPPFRFDHEQLQWELEMILATGMEVRTNSPIGTGPDDIKLDDLLAEYDAVFVSI